MLAQAMQKNPARDVNVVEGDLIDLSDDLTIKDVAIQPEAEDTARLLEDLNILEASREPPGELVEVSKTASDPPANMDEATEHTETSLLSHADLTHRSTTAGMARKQIANSYTRNQTSVSSSDGHHSPVPDRHAETLTFNASPSRETITPVGKQQEAVERSTRSSRSRKQHKEVRFGEYVLGPTVGEGDEAKVKMAWKRGGVVQVVIKLIRRDTPGSHSARLPKLYRQAAILRGLKHPSIVRLRELIETERHVGIVLEYASGGPLTDYVDQHRFLKDKAARRLFAQLISGVGYLHQKGVVHRNLKLDNVLLDQNRNIIIAGFKSAKGFNPDDKISEEYEDNLDDPVFLREMGVRTVNEDGNPRGDLMQTTCGSSQYAAPEVMASDALYTGRKADVWSCGVILVRKAYFT